MASEEKSMLKQLGERHEKLKHKIHTTKIPIKSKWGRSAMGMLYATITFGVCWGLTRSMRVEERGYDVEGSAKRLGLDMEAVEEKRQKRLQVTGGVPQPGSLQDLLDQAKHKRDEKRNIGQ
mmetsp:Transcript_20529/g.83319  ORF Transcript_20529/g.83319 Transcript_20529/m.83319 type:complete len:121 (-) Transcript_20529:616-978(-)